MSEFVINSEQLERLIEGIEHNTGRKVTQVIYDGTELPVIVRCRDCAKAEHAEVHRFDGVRRYEWTCKRFPTFIHETSPDGFCWKGERK